MHFQRHSLFAWCGLLCFILAGSAKVSPAEDIFPHAVVAADHPEASRAGAIILQKGGNAVDAAVATSFALSVCRPASCGIGGGGFMVIWDAKTQTAVALDYRERAPASADASLFDVARGDSKEAPGVRGGLASGIPGTVAGLCYAAEHYGTLPLAELIQPSIDLCREGVLIDEHDMEVQASVLQTIHRYPSYEKEFAPLIAGYLNGGVAWKKGDRFHSPQLEALKRIAAEGAAGFYRGTVAAEMVAVARQHGGVLTEQDLAGYQPTVRQPLRDRFHEFEVLTMPPPSSGGIALLQSLQILEAWEKQHEKPLSSMQRNSPEYVHLVTETLKHAFADRAEFLGDTDFVSVPVEKLLSEEYAVETARRIDAEQTQKLEAYGRFFLNDDGGTSHFSIMDRDGNAVACTETINLTFGSFVVAPESGVVLNNQMDDFATQPGKPNAFGLIQSAANRIEPGKRPLSSMTPTILVKDGKASISCGASGGPRIITATLQNLLNQAVFGLTPEQAVSSARFHHQWSPNELLLEPDLASTIAGRLQDIGHTVRKNSSLAATQGTSLTTEGLRGGSDPRKHGRPAGH